MKKITISLFIFAVLLIPSFAQLEAKTTKSPYGPSALCKDGTYSYSLTRRGTCSYHKGVRTWYR